MRKRREGMFKMMRAKHFSKDQWDIRRVGTHFKRLRKWTMGVSLA